MISRRIVSRLMLALAVAGLASQSIANAEEVTIKIENFTFNPPELTVKPGTTVKWENDDDIPHSILEEKTAFRSKPLDTGEEFKMTFDQPGEVTYFCGLHPHMKGKIIVKP